MNCQTCSWHAFLFLLPGNVSVLWHAAYTRIIVGPMDETVVFWGRKDNGLNHTRAVYDKGIFYTYRRGNYALQTDEILCNSCGSTQFYQSFL